MGYKIYYNTYQSRFLSCNIIGLSGRRPPNELLSTSGIGVCSQTSSE